MEDFVMKLISVPFFKTVRHHPDLSEKHNRFEISLFDKPIRFSFSKTENTAHFRNRYTYLIQIQHLQIVMINPSC